MTDASENSRRAKAPTEPVSDESGPQVVAGEVAREAGKVREIGGREGPDPTRYGDWEKNGRCIDF